MNQLSTYYLLMYTVNVVSVLWLSTDYGGQAKCRVID